MHILPVLKSGTLVALYAADAACTESMTLIAELGLRGAVTILDGGNRAVSSTYSMVQRDGH